MGFSLGTLLTLVVILGILDFIMMFVCMFVIISNYRYIKMKLSQITWNKGGYIK